MALIPPDAGIRMRMQTDTSLLQPTTPPPQGIPSELLDLRQGQTFTARIQEALPENTFKALVAGKQLTLQLPEGAKAGDTLELVVIDRTAKVIIARLANAQQAAEAGEAYPYTKLSSAGRMIGQLLLPEGETPAAAALNRGQPLLAQPPANAAELAPALQRAVAQSGLFYEAHQAQWIAGRFPVEGLLQEPQGQLSAAFAQRGLPLPALPAAAETAGDDMHDAGAAVSPRAQGTGEATARAMTDAPPPPTLLQRLFGGAEAGEAPAAAQAAAAGAVTQAIPEELRPLVQQQLDAAATQRLAWHGEVWPNQTMDWEVVREDEAGAQAGAEDEPAWRTRLALDTPRLGRVDASLRLTAAGLQLTLEAPTEAAATKLREAAPALSASLDAAGIALLSFLVRHEPA